MPSLAVKPERAPVHLDLIPPEMKSASQWLGWKWTKNDKGRFDKPPYSIRTGYQCDKTDRDMYASLNEAAGAMDRFDGLGFAFTADDDFAFIDLDKCINVGTGEITADARYVVELADSYTEISPSGTGLKIYIIANMPENYRHQDEAKGFEIYHEGAYSCVTGNHFADAPTTIRTLSAGDVQRILDFMFPPSIPDCKPPVGFDVDEVELARSAICAISPSYAESYHDWLKVGMAAHATSNSSDMLAAWEAWSMESPKFREGECGRKWKSFGTGSRAVTIGTLIHLAKENGWSPPWKLNGHAHASINDTATANTRPLPPIEDAYALCARDVPEPPELIQGVLHKGSKLQFGGASKSYTTWTLDYLALAVAYGLPWLGFESRRSKVLLLNMELQEAFCRRRLITLQDALEIKPEPGWLDVWNLRGYTAGHREIFPRIIERIAGDNYGLVIPDPIYKLYGADTDENTARDVAALLNSMETLTVKTGAAIAYRSHFSKGNQAGKNAIDRVSGSGVFARDPDTLLNLTAHAENECCYALEATLRNFPPIEPVVVEWRFPLFERRNDLDPAALKQIRQRTTHTTETVLAALVDGMATTEWQAAAGIRSHHTFNPLRDRLLSSGQVRETNKHWWKVWQSGSVGNANDCQ